MPFNFLHERRKMLNYNNYDFVKRIRNFEYQIKLACENGEIAKADFLYEDMLKFLQLLEDKGIVLTEEFKDYQNYRNRVKRARKKIENILSLGPCVFLTLTFTDKVLESTSKDTRKRYIKRFLHSISSNYVANIDFGKQNGREHYHAIVQIDKVDFTTWHYGAINGKKIAFVENPIALAKYIVKLSNHALKLTTKGFKLIYSR